MKNIYKFVVTLEYDYSISEIYYKEAKKQDSVEAKYKLAKLY